MIDRTPPRKVPFLAPQAALPWVANGTVIAVVLPGRYTVALGTGALITADAVWPGKGYAAAFAPNSQVLCARSERGTWYILGSPNTVFADPQQQKTNQTPVPTMDHPRIADMSSGEIAIVYPDKASGLHLHSSGAVELSTATPNSDPEKIISAKIFLVPISDAIHSTSRRASSFTAAGDMIFAHDDETGDSAVRFFVRSSTNPGSSEKRVRLNMGRHTYFDNVMFALETFPPGTPPPAPAEILPSAKQRYDGAIPSTAQDRLDFSSAIFLKDDGTIVICTTDSIAAKRGQPNNLRTSMNFDQAGVITVDASKSFVLAAKKNFQAKSPKFEIDGRRNDNATGPYILIQDSNLVKAICNDIRLGVEANVKRLLKEAMYNFISQWKTIYDGHSHPVTGKTTLAPLQKSPTLPAPTDALTQQVKAS